MYKVLFVGTHDRFRSKFASLYFNAKCEEQGLPLKSFSVGFDINNKIYRGVDDTPAQDYLGSLGHLTEKDAWTPSEINDGYFDSCQKFICMNMEEHLTMLRKKFPTQVRKCDYWHYPDRFSQPPFQTLTLIKKEVDHLIASLNLVETAVD